MFRLNDTVGDINASLDGMFMIGQDNLIKVNSEFQKQKHRRTVPDHRMGEMRIRLSIAINTAMPVTIETPQRESLPVDMLPCSGHRVLQCIGKESVHTSVCVEGSRIAFMLRRFYLKRLTAIYISWELNPTQCSTTEPQQLDLVSMHCKKISPKSLC